jgi:FAD/FMN-containing dehydrogenase
VAETLEEFGVDLSADYASFVRCQVVGGLSGRGGGCDPDAMHEEEVYSHYFYDA